jgi:hypothetical protein
MTVNEITKRIKADLKRRSGKSWSVTHGAGTAYGWITIRSTDYERNGHTLTADQQAELKRLLGGCDVHHQGVSIPAGTVYYREYLDRAAGLKPAVCGTPYWD